MDRAQRDALPWSKHPSLYMLGIFFFFGPGSLLLLLRLKSDRFHFYGLTRNPVMNCKLSLSLCNILFFFVKQCMISLLPKDPTLSLLSLLPAGCCLSEFALAGWPAWHRTNGDTPRLGIITPQTSFFYPAVVSPIRAFGQVTRFDPITFIYW